MNKKKLMIILSAGIILSCSKGDKYSAFNSFSAFIISETLATDNPDERIQKTETFAFNDDRLQSATVTQVIPHFNHTTECQSNLSHINTHVTVSDCTGGIATYTLNKDKYAVSCDVEESGLLRHYEFTYKDGYLGSVTETINGSESFRMELFYDKGSLVKTTESIHNNEHILRFTPTPEKNVAKLPLLYLTEIYPLYFHKMAIYAGFLGKAPQHLIQQITSETSQSDTANYSYKFNNNYVINCRIEVITSGGNGYRSLQFYYGETGN